MSNQVKERLFNILIRFGFYLEPLAPPAISYYISRRLDHLKQRGLISSYNTNTKRLGKFHYKVQVDLDLTGEQAFYVFDDILPQQFKHIREVIVDG